MENFIIFLYNSIKSPHFLFLILCISAFIKIYYLSILGRKIFNEQLAVFPLLFLFTSILSTVICDISWFTKLLHALFIPMPYYIVVFFIRCAWAFLVIQYYSLSLFLESLTNAQFSFQKNHIPITGITGLCASYFFFLAFFQPFTLATEHERDIARISINTAEFFIMRYVVVSLISIFMMIGLYKTYKNMKGKQLPKILRKQLFLFIYFFIIPYLAVEFILAVSFNTINEMYFIVNISTLLITAAISYCLSKVLKLRFINTTTRVQELPKPHVLEQFKAVLEQLSNTKSMEELGHITQSFFKEAFSLSAQSVNLLIRDHANGDTNPETLHRLKQVDLFINQEITDACCQVYQHIFVRDEISFNHFYEETNESKAILPFLDCMNADIFLPIFSNKHHVGAIIIQKNSRAECFSQAEQDAMVAFANYLGNIIHLLHNKNLDLLISKKKKLKDQLYIKHQEINHYKESIQAFLRHSKEKALGIIFYKNGRFTNGNHNAATVVRIDLNIQEGHPLTQAFKEVVSHVQMYKGPYNHYTRDTQGLPLILSGVPHLEQQSIIITASYPDINDVIMQQMYSLNNPADWDYLLYLSSTKTGALINDLIPGSGEILLNIKIALLKAALTKKTLLLDVPDPDLFSIVQLIHTISARETLRTLELNEPVKSPDIPAMLFGDTIVNLQKDPLLKIVDGGTLFIKNIHFIDKITQEHLIEYIMYGLYRLYNSDQKMASNARIICSTNQNMTYLVQEGSFIPKFVNLLKQATVQIPSLFTLPQQELRTLIDGYSDKIITAHPMKNLLVLNEKEKIKIIEQPPSSFRELRLLLEQTILNKAAEAALHLHYHTSTEGNDVDFIEAARLGKQALKKPELMKKLWGKFKNQNKIALFLGVNRSSVNRRCKLYDIGDISLHDEPQGTA